MDTNTLIYKIMCKQIIFTYNKSLCVKHKLLLYYLVFIDILLRIIDLYNNNNNRYDHYKNKIYIYW